jgi:DNA-binding NtrC family response regulator
MGLVGEGDLMPNDAARGRLVAVINTSEDVVRLLCDALELEGFRTVADYVINYRTTREDLAAFFAQHDPDVVIWDIAIPYAENWAFFQRVRHGDGGNRRRFVVTTTNKRALESIVGPTAAIEIIGKPYDLDLVIAAVWRALGED